MKKYGVFYGSATGTTADVAVRIASALGVSPLDVMDVKNANPVQLGDYETLVLGTSTWGAGEIEDDWYDFLDGAQAMDLSGKKIALFGCGDENMTDTFCNGVEELHKRLKDTGATFIGEFNTDGLEFDHSDAVREDGLAVGLLLDETNKAELTPEKISAWTETIKNS